MKIGKISMRHIFMISRAPDGLSNLIRQREIIPSSKKKQKKKKKEGKRGRKKERKKKEGRGKGKREKDNSHRMNI